MKNLNSYITIILFVFAGIILAPQVSTACSKKTTASHTSSSKKEHLKKVAHHSCNDKSCKKCKSDGSCEGGCKHNSCRCTTSANPLHVAPLTHLEALHQFADSKKQKFAFTKAHYSSGFFTIWQPPKIS